MTTLSNSQEELLSARIKDICKNDTTTKETIEDVKEMCSKNSLDWNKVAAELNRVLVNTAEVRNVKAFCKAVTYKLTSEKKSLFFKDKNKPCFNSLHKALKDIGVTGETWEIFYVNEIEEHALKEFFVSVDDLTLTNRAIVEYCKNKGIKTYHTFIELLLKSRALKNTPLPLEVLKAEAKRWGEECDKLEGDLYVENFND